MGGTVGGIAAWRMSNGKFYIFPALLHILMTGRYSVSGTFKPVSHIIKNELTVRQKEKLYEHIMASVRDIDVTDVAILMPLLLNNASIQQKVLTSVATFIGNELSMQIVD